MQAEGEGEGEGEGSEQLRKYRKMKEMLPEGAVRQKMRADGFRPEDIDAFLLTGKLSALGLGLPETPPAMMMSVSALKAAPPPSGPKPKAAPSMLDEILSGPKLKAVTVEPKAAGGPSKNLQGAGGILGMLALEMSKRRVNITAAADEQDSDSDSSGFSDSDSDSD